MLLLWLSALVGLTWSGVVETRTTWTFWMKLTSARLTCGGILKNQSHLFNLKTPCLTAEVLWPVKTTVQSYSSHAVFLCLPETGDPEEVQAGASDWGWWSLQLQPSLKQARPAELWYVGLQTLNHIAFTAVSEPGLDIRMQFIMCSAFSSRGNAKWFTYGKEIC